MSIWQHIANSYIRPAPADFAAAALILAVCVPGVLGALILGWPELIASVVGVFSAGYILRGNAWKARAMAAEADAASELTRHDQDHSHYEEGR